MKEKLIFEEIDEITEQDDASLDFLKRRLIGAVAIILIFVSVIVSRLWYLQINKGAEYRERAYNNRVRIRQVAAPRGHIVDRNGKEIVTNRPSFNVVLVREDSYDIDDVLNQLARVCKIDVAEFWKRIDEAQGTPKYIPIRLMEDIDWDTLAYLENHNQDFSGIRIEVQPVRVYHYQDLAANTIGYIGEINKKELKKAKPGLYIGGDQIGKSGLEKLREADLRGEKGSRSSEVNAKGFEQQLLTNIDPLPGRELMLTIDAELQQVAEKYMEIGEKSGAVVAMEVDTGRVLTIVSAPPIHLEHFVGGISVKHWKELLENPKTPLLNKSVQAAYPPGSTYKMITALAGLSKGVIDLNTKFFCPGYYRFGNRTYRCWRHSGHGEVDLQKAIEQSCDVYFYQVGQKVGVDGLAEVAKLFGLGTLSGIDVENEKAGLVPTKAWKKRVIKEKWHEGETLSVAIGQGFNTTTPLQICNMTAAIANAGKLYMPKVVERVTDADGNVVESFKPTLIRNLDRFSRFFPAIHEGMTAVVQGKRGTARNVRIEGITIAGKTGTAQVVKVAKYKHLKEEDVPSKYRDHAWFTCFAPADKPEIAVTVLVEHGLHGGSGAGPIARAVLKKYFEKKLSESETEKVEKEYTGEKEYVEN